MANASGGVAKSGRYKGLAKSSFALPSENAYPINTAKRARSALSRISANGTPAQKTEVRKAVKKKFPSIAVTGLPGKKKSNSDG